jgi:GTPase-associated system helical domain
VSENQEILLSFLSIGVINVGGDDTKLEKIRAAVEDLAADVKKYPVKAIKYTVVAADPDVETSDPTIEAAMTVLRGHWTTVSNTFQATPIAIVRAMLLDAIVQCARTDDATGVAFVNSARNILPYVPSGNERPIWLDAVKEIEAKVDSRAVAEWATPEMISLKPLTFRSPQAKPADQKYPTVNRNTLSTMILRASGPVGGGDQNPHWVNSPQPWTQQFAPRMATAIAEAIDDTVGGLKIEPIDISGPFQNMAKTISAHIETALAAVSRATAGLERRTNLLWWKEALYSPSARVSYRRLPAFEAAALMAVDLFHQVPAFSPASVSAFLSEAIQLLPLVTAAEKRGFFDLVKEAHSAEALDPLRTIATQLVEAPVGRGSLLSLIGYAPRTGVLDAASLKRLGGMDDSSTLMPADWGAFLFRELQAARAVKPAGAKGEDRKGE